VPIRKTRTRLWLAPALGTLCAAALTQPAAAEEGFALGRFDPAPAGDRQLSVPSAAVNGDGVLHLGVLADYAYNPLALTHAKAQPEVGAVVSDQLVLHVGGTYALWDRLALHLDVPFAVYQAGDDPVKGTETFASPNDAVLGDVRVGLRLGLFGKPGSMLQASVGGSLWLPTGDQAQYTSDGSLRGMPQLLLGGEGHRVLWSLAVGAEFRGARTYDDAGLGSILRASAGFGVKMGEDQNVTLGPELNLGISTEDTRKKNTNAELLLGARYRFRRDFEVGGGFGPGLSGGYGTPDVRAVAMLGYSPDPRPSDRDHDGVIDIKDHCPEAAIQGEADPARPGCTKPPPPPDRDKDGLADGVDACPDTLGVAHAKPERNGCPSDRDDDAIEDAKDACPDAAGVASAELAKNGCPLPADSDTDGVPDVEDACPALRGIPAAKGCPPDSDGDGVRDDQDACPAEKGETNADPQKNGCPTSVRVTGTDIVILDQVLFETGRDKIKPESDGLVAQVAGVLKEHPEITRVEIQGHTDNKGPRVANVNLSQQRADAVKAALVAKGVEDARLVAKGYGPDKPIMANLTEEGRAKNRRVEFKILERKQ
jgi:OOP family OmpA-OmpF porin